MLSAALLTRYSQALLAAAPPIWPMTLLMKAKRPPAASTSGATCGMTCIAPSTLACITRSKSVCVGGCVASARLHVDALQAAGFRVTQGVADIPTAFIAEAGSGTPVIGILGEYDALSGLSQAAGAFDCRPAPGAAHRGIRR